MIEVFGPKEGITTFIQSMQELNDAKKIWKHMIVLTKRHDCLREKEGLLSLLWHVLVYIRYCNSSILRAMRENQILEPAFSKHLLHITRTVNPYINAFLSEASKCKQEFQDELDLDFLQESNSL